jgi:hypothetical protein
MDVALRPMPSRGRNAYIEPSTKSFSKIIFFRKKTLFLALYLRKENLFADINQRNIKRLSGLFIASPKKQFLARTKNDTFRVIRLLGGK